MVMGAVRALCELSVLVNQQNHSDLFLKTLDNALKRFYQRKGIFRQQKMSKSANAKVDNLLATESNQICEQKIHLIRTAMEAHVYGAEMVSTTKRRIVQVRRNGAHNAATTWSDADHQKAFEQLEGKIHQVTPAKCKHFDKLFQCHERQLLQTVRTKATGPRCKFAKELALKNTTAEDEACGAANMTADKRLQFQNRLSNAETEATTWSSADTQRVTN
jgi:hypothetical protein